MTATQRSAATSPRRAVPALDVSSPLRLVAVTAAAFAILLAVAAVVPIETGPVVTVNGRVRAEPVLVRHPDGGQLARFLVKEGADVEAGALIAVLESRLIETQIAGLKRQMDGIQLHVSGLKQEAEALAATDRQSAQRSRLAGLEAQIAASEQESLGLQVRLAMTEQEKSRTVVRAPLAGRIVKLVAHEAATVLPSGVIAELQPAPDRLVLETTVPRAHASAIVSGQSASVWPAGTTLWPTLLSGRVEHAVADPLGTRLRVVVDLTGTDMTTAPDRERPFAVQVATGKASILSAFLAPLSGGLASQRAQTKDQP